MPSGRAEVIPTVVNLVMAQNPTSILDVGSGFGKWGLLLREYLEVWQGRIYTWQWQKRIDAMECFAPYTGLPWYRSVYDHVYIGGVQYQEDLLWGYDLVLLGDVIEHLPKEIGKAVLERCKKYIVTTPAYESEQGVSFGNEAERHVSLWSIEDFPHAELVAGRWIVGWNSEA